MNKKILSFLLAFAVILNVGAQKKNIKTTAQTQTVKVEQPKLAKTVEGVKEYSLSNGLQILLVPDASQSNVVVNIVYKVGARHEGYGEKGMAHLLEHMLFKSTKNLGDIKKMLTDKGGNANGTTSDDRTNYYEVFPSTDENLQWSIQMEADRMINATMLQSDLDKEFSVVRNEFEIGENDPESILMERIVSTAYLWHNYGNSTIGSKEDIERVKADRLKVFYQKYYQPDNAVLIVGGKFDEAKVLQYIADYFSVIPRPTRVLDKTYTIEPAQDGERSVELKRNGDSYFLGAAYHTVSYADKDFAAINALVTILTSDPSGYIYKALIDKKEATQIWGYQPNLRDASYAYFGLTVPKDKNINEVKKLFVSELDKIRTIQYTQDDLSRAKSKLLKSFENTNNNTINKVAGAFTNIIGAGDYKLFYIYRDNVENLTLDEVKNVAEKYFLTNNRTFGAFIPTKDEIRVKSDEITDEQLNALVQNYQGKAQDEEVQLFEATIANVQNNLTEKTLQNGFKYGVLNKSLKGKKITARFRIPFGTAETLSGKTEIVKILPYMLKAGTKDLTKEQITDKLDQMKSSIGFGAGGQIFYIYVNSYEQFAEPVFELLRSLLTESVFPQNEFDKTLTQMKADIEAGKNDPKTLAFLEIGRIGNPYPKTSVYYQPSMDEKIELLGKATRQQVIDLYSNLLGAGSSVGTVISGIPADKVSQIIEKTFGNWNAKTKFVKVEPTYFDTKETYKEILTPDKENAVNVSQINFKMKESDADYPALEIANEMLGSGGFLNSRIAKRLRENEGISYGAGAYLSVPVDDEDASWFGYAFYNPTKKDLVNSALKDEISKALESGFDEKEMKDAIGSWKNSRNTALGMDNYLLEIINKHLFYSVSLEEFNNLEKKINDLKTQEVNQVLKKYINLDKLIILNVGDFNKK
ncbi:MAG: insulinase family protein [Flavobacteriaceae bacterium]|jgi:zinc protease|nr:insulinase family protein [Flavobacteriaceae bacterium]